MYCFHSQWTQKNLHSGTESSGWLRYCLLFLIYASYKEVSNNSIVNRRVIPSYAIQMTCYISVSHALALLLKLTISTQFCHVKYAKSHSIHNTHCTFRAWLLPFSFIMDNLNAISCIHLNGCSID